RRLEQRLRDRGPGRGGGGRPRGLVGRPADVGGPEAPVGGRVLLRRLYRGEESRVRPLGPPRRPRAARGAPAASRRRGGPPARGGWGGVGGGGGGGWGGGGGAAGSGPTGGSPRGERRGGPPPRRRRIPTDVAGRAFSLRGLEGCRLTGVMRALVTLHCPGCATGTTSPHFGRAARVPRSSPAGRPPASS